MSKALFVVAGHGLSENMRYDNGAIGNQTNERKEVVEIAQELIQKLEGNSHLHPVFGVGISTRMSLQEKIAFVERECIENNLNSNNSLLVSIHINAASNEYARGVEVWYAMGKVGARGFARIITEKTAKYSGFPVRRYPVQASNNNRHGRLAILDNTLPLAILIECGFLTNEFDSEVIKDEHLDDGIAEGIYRGLLSFMGEEDSVEDQGFYRDVYESEWYYDAVKFCLEQGIFKMNDEHLFYPDKPIDRATLAQVVHRILEKL